MTLLSQVGTRFVRRDALADIVQQPGTARFDLCFIDAEHSYRSIKADYGELAPSCRWAMFHDINDETTLSVGRAAGGGVLGFWQQLKEHVRAARRFEFTMQTPPAPDPAFGIGLVAPDEDARGTAEPDGAAVAAWKDYSRTAVRRGGGGEERVVFVDGSPRKRHESDHKPG